MTYFLRKHRRLYLGGRPPGRAAAQGPELGAKILDSSYQPEAINNFTKSEAMGSGLVKCGC